MERLIFDRAGLATRAERVRRTPRQKPQRPPAGPVAALVTARVVERRGIDPAFEDVLEQRVERVLLQRALVKSQIAKRRNVAFVKCKRMAQRNRAIVKRVVVNQREERGRALPVLYGTSRAASTGPPSPSGCRCWRS